ncbi:MAG: Transglutaminase protein [Chloroflexi bacterium]|nr:Transglutaminase protein [Chloroflexota bacterium]
MNRLRLRDMWLPALLVAILAVNPAASIQAAGWSDRLEPVPWFALAGVVAGIVFARSRLNLAFSLLLGAAIGAALSTLQYAWFLPEPSVPARVGAFVNRLSDWVAAVFSGAASTDNLLFAYQMSLWAWTIGYLGSFFAFRRLTPWWAIVPSGSALLLNLSYAPPQLLPLVFVHLISSFLLMIAINSVEKVARWRTESAEQSFSPGIGFAASTFVVGVLVIGAAWRMPVGEVQRGVASAWENVAGPWQSVQANFDRLFASLNPSPQSGRGLTAALTMAPRGSFELGDKPVMRVGGRDPAYWRAVTYDRYTGNVMANSAISSQRLDRRQPLEGSMETDAGRKLIEYTVTLLAPTASVIYAPDTPLTVGVPTVYDYRADPHDFGSLRPVIPIREQQRYSVLTAVSTASINELRQAGTIYPPWTRPYLQLPTTLPEPVRQESWRVVGDATNVYDAAARVEEYLRGFRYSTRVQMPPSDQDWVSFLLFQSREGYCDYYATAMTVMLRAVGIPARVASGYVTGDWDPPTQSYLVTEAHAHTWTEVYFPRYGWITFEPSAIRPAPVRLENPLVALTEEEFLRILESERGVDEFLDDEDLYDSGNFLPLPANQTGPAYPPGLILLFVLMGLVGVGAIVMFVLWARGIGNLPLFARPYAQTLRLATWCGLGPKHSQTPYEYTTELARVVPAAGPQLVAIADAYVAGAYGGKEPDLETLRELKVYCSDRSRSTDGITGWTSGCER